MVRRHGWQLPAHTFQVIAITVFFMLVIAFYVFFAPFLGKRIFHYVAIAIYTPVAIAVFILYIRCTRINPADPGIMGRFDDVVSNIPNKNPGLQNMNLPVDFDNAATGTHSSPSSDCRSSVDGSHKKVSARDDMKIDLPMAPPRKRSICCWKLGGLFYLLFAKDDCRRDDVSEQQTSGEDALFCTLCNAEVRKFSKHCRSCDKCVDGFDHHCRWLNNCVGRKNYISFISLMAVSLVWLVVEFIAGAAVFVLCFVHKKDMEKDIVDKLGNGFSRAPFTTIVAFFTALSLLASVPLAELFFFHMILIKKGITTYEYVVAMRAMSEAPPASADEELRQEALYSPTNSATTGLSGGSSIGLQYKGVWCTPPRVFVDQQDEIIPHLGPGMVPSTVDPDAAGNIESGSKSKKPVKISAWKLAKLDSNEVMRAAAKARASSSVLRPIEGRRVLDVDGGSSGNASIRSSMSIDYNAIKDLHTERKPSPLRNSYPQSIASKEDYESITPTASTFSSPGHIHEPVALNPLPLQQSLPVRSLIPRPPRPNIQHTNPMFQTATSLIRESKKPSVVWDQEAGRYVSVPASETSVEAPSKPHIALSIHSAETNGYGRRPNVPSSSTAAPVQQPERFTYTGQSIFYGGPLLGAASGDNDHRNEGTSRSRPENQMESTVRQQVMDQFPVFAPGGFPKNGTLNIK